MATMLPVAKSKTRIWFLPAPPANSKSSRLLIIVVYKKGAMAGLSFLRYLVAAVVASDSLPLRSSRSVSGSVSVTGAISLRLSVSGS